MPKRIAKPALHIPLTDEQLKMIGEICAIQGQIEMLMTDTVILLLAIRPAAGNAIMATTSMEAKASIWLEVIHSKLTDANILSKADTVFGMLKQLTKGRNDFIHAFYAKETISKAILIVASDYPETFDINPGDIVAVRTRGGARRLVSDIKRVRDGAADLSTLFIEIKSAISHLLTSP
jgi:hypothetical protein